MHREKLINQIMADAEKDGEPVTREEAEEMAEMEIKANGIKNYVQDTTEKKTRKPRERKVDEDKKAILEFIKYHFLNDGLLAFVDIKNETELNFQFRNDKYTLKLIKHRPPK